MKKVLSLLLAAVMLLSLCPTVFADDTIRANDTVEFGSYPQTMMTDEALIAALDAKATSWTSYNYSYRVAGLSTVQTGDFMKYCDVTYNGAKYRGVKMTAFRPDRTDSMCIRPLNSKYELNKIYWFEYQPLTWRVLDASTGLMICDQIIDAQPFFSDGLTYYPGNAAKYRYKTAAKDYPNIYGAVTGSIGAWLPDTFRYTAFSTVERSKLQAHLVNRSNTDSNFNKSSFSTSVFLLTLSEVSTYMPRDNNYPTKNNRGAKSSDYAKIQGAESFYYCLTEENYFYENCSHLYEAMGNSSWLTATSGSYSHYAKCIAATGNSENVDVRYSRAGIRPAVQLGSANLQTLSRHRHYTSGGPDYTVDIGRTEPTCTNPGVTEDTGWYCTICNTYYRPEPEEHLTYDMGEDHDFHVDDTACTAGDALMFGSYPQSRVYDDDVISQLSTMQLTWKSYDYYTFYDSVKGAFVKSDYMKYTDVDLDGDGRNDYRGVTFSKYRPGTAFSTGISDMKYCLQYQNGYYTNTVYWFKYEPLIWRVLDRDNGILMCEYAIDAQAFNDIYYEIDANGNGNIDDYEYFLDKKGEVYANDYTQSSLRKYLNGSFLNTAFSSAEKKSLADTTVAVKGESFNGIGIRSEEYYSSVTDKVFMLSFDEYMYSGLINNCDDTCAVYPTDYALCQGCRPYGDDNCSVFWLRNSSDSDAFRAQIMYKCSEDNDYVDSYFGIAPVIKVNNIEELLHVHDIVYDEEVLATCTKDGKTAGRHCETCGKIFIKQEKIDKLGHDPKPVAAVAPTCETVGNNAYYVCARCEKAFTDAACTVATTVKTQTLAALGHDWDEGTVTKAPTCTLKGSATLTCQRAGCDKTKTETIPVDENAHKWGAWTTVTAPTCTAAGSEKKVCTNNKNHTETRTIAPIGHDWDEGTVTTPATCVKKGEKTYSCKRAGCTETKTETIAKDAAKHGEKEIKNAAAATCGKDGYTGDTYCKDCGAKTAVGTVIKATGAHTWDVGKVTKEAAVGVPGVKTYTCTVCGNTKTEDIPALKDEGCTPGDVDEDGKITAADARLALRRSVGLEDYKEGSPKFLACDVDFDGKVTAADARLILRASVGLEDAKTWKPAK